METFTGLAQFEDATGRALGPTDWLEITQDRVDMFADATDDHQWIHTDPVRAADGPFGATIAHGLLTLSLLPRFGEAVQATMVTTVEIEGADKPAAVIESIVRYLE